MPIPDWVWRETRHIHEKAFHVLAAMFVDGREFVLEDGSEVRVLREEYPVEEGLVLRDACRRVWRQLEAKGLVRFQAADHMAINGRLKGSYVVSLQDPIAQFSSVRNKDARPCAILPASAPLQGEEFESEARRLTRARANIIPHDAPAATHHPTTATTPTPTSAPSTPSSIPEPQQPLPTLEEALRMVGFTEDGQASELLSSFGFNNVAVAVRYLVRGLKRSRRGQQPPIGSKTGYVIQFLGFNRSKQFEEVEDFSFLSYLQGWVATSDPKVLEFPGSRGEA